MTQNLALMACNHCNLVAVPLEFDGPAEQRAFREAQSGRGGWTRVE